MKKIIFTVITVVMIAITAIILLKGKDLIPSFGLAEEKNTNISEKNNNLKTTYKVNDVISTKDLNITVRSATISKKLNNLPIPELASMAIPPSIDINKSFDSSFNFTDNNNYLQIELIIENTLDESQIISLNNFRIVKENMALITESVLTSTNTNFDKNMFKYEITGHEQRHIFLGYIITDEVKEENKENIYLSINLNGTSEINKEKDYDKRMVRLEFE